MVTKAVIPAETRCCSRHQNPISANDVAPMTSQGFAAPFRVPVTHAGTQGLIVLDQMRTVDKIRLAKKLGAVSAKTLSATLAALQEIFEE